MDEGSKITSVRIDNHRLLKMFAADNDTSLAAIVNKSIEKNKEISLEGYK